MINLWDNEENCTGCAACMQICQKAAISMKENRSGFLFPEIDKDLCIECGACVRVCPVHQKPVSPAVPQAFALRHHDPEVLKQSSSGGAFTAIAQAFAQGEYAIIGASMDEHLRVSHEIIYDIKDLDRLRRSKYVQSNTQRCFIEGKRLLREGRKVLFVGTPCQVAGFKSYLGRKEPELITCDLVCEGVQSQKFFDRYIEFEQDKHGSNVVAVEFRSKDKHGWERSDFVLHFADGKKYRRMCHCKDIPYMNSSLFRGGNRDSCYHCRFDRLPRYGDFTIGDLWGWRKMVPEWKENKGISLVLVNTEKAKKMLPQLNCFAEIKEVDLLQAVQKNPNVISSTTEPPLRKEYMEDLCQKSFSDLAKKWLKSRSLLRRILSHIKYKVKGIS